MSVPVLIFSAESIRGNILFNALRQKGYDVRLHDKTINAENIISASGPSVLILDVKSYYTKELEFFLSAKQVFSGSSLILLTALTQGIPVEFINTKVDACLPDPLDVHLILAQVRELQSATEAGISEPAVEEPRPEPEPPVRSEKPVDADKEPDEDQPSQDKEALEEDLKRLLDLE